MQLALCCRLPLLGGETPASSEKLCWGEWALQTTKGPLERGCISPKDNTPQAAKKRKKADRQENGKEADGRCCSLEEPLSKNVQRKKNFLSLPTPPAVAYLLPKPDLPRENSRGVHLQDQQRGEKEERGKDLVLHHFGPPEWKLLLSDFWQGLYELAIKKGVDLLWVMISPPLQIHRLPPLTTSSSQLRFLEGLNQVSFPGVQLLFQGPFQFYSG